MQDEKFKLGRFDWFTVSYSTIVAWIIIVIIVIGAGIFAYYFYLRNPSSEEQAQRAITKAEKLISEIRMQQAGRAITLDKPLEYLMEAKRFRDQGDFIQAKNLAEESQRHSQEILDSLRQGEEGEQRAYLTSVEGRIEVKRKGAVDWIEGKEGMALSAGDLVKTANNSTSHIMFFDHSSYILRPNTMIAVQESYEDPFSRTRRVTVKLDFGAVDLTTGKKNVPGSSSTIASPTTKAVMGEESNAALSFNQNSSVTSFSLYSGTADVNAGKKKIPIIPLEQIKIDKNEEVTSKVKILLAPLLLRPANEEQFLFENPEESRIDFIWQNIKEAQSYNLEISRTSLFSQPILLRRGIVENRFSLGNFTEGIYYWRVSSFSPGKGESRFSDANKFRIRKISRRLTSEDTTPPVLEVDELKVLGNIILIFGKTEPDVLLTINNKRVDVDSDGTFKDVIELHKLGKNKLIITAQDPSGNKEVLEREVYITEY
jgi:hypothetical protein